MGTELLLGDIVNTNAQFLSRELAGLGIDVYYQTVVGDNPGRLRMAYEAAFSRADLVIASGGLGPTEDDLTKEIAAEYFGKQLLCHDDVLAGIEAYFHQMNRPMTKNNQKQALVPEGARILPNDRGTAPGLLMEEGDKILVMLPGPPFEMEHMFRRYVRPYLAEKQEYMFISRTLRLCGIGESAAEEALKDMLDVQTNPTIAPYAGLGEMRFRITAKVHNEAEARQLIEPIAEEIYRRMGQYIYAEGETSLASAVVGMLLDKGQTIAVAESCTGGLLAAALTDMPGASGALMEGAVTYSNEAKKKRLGVKEETLAQYGAVSPQTAAEMAEGIAKAAGTHIGVGVTGIAGPDGGTAEKPVGLVYVGLWHNGHTQVEKLNLAGDRKRVRQRTVINALDLIRKALLAHAESEDGEK